MKNSRSLGNSRNFHPIRRKTTLGVLFGFAAMAPLSQAAMLTINITDSSYLRSTPPGTVQLSGNAVSNLIGDITTSENNPDDDIRAIFAVSLTDPALVGATITGATLRLKISATDASSSSSIETIQLFQLTQPFVESEASWTNRATGTPWTTPGGTFDSGSVLASVNANPFPAAVGDALDFTSVSLASLAESSIGGTLYFVVKLANEDNVARSLFRVGGDDNTETAYRPQFEIQYTPVPEPSAFAMLGGMGCLALIRRRRQS